MACTSFCWPSVVSVSNMSLSSGRTHVADTPRRGYLSLDPKAKPAFSGATRPWRRYCLSLSLSAFPRYQVIEMAKNQVSPNGVVFAFVVFFDHDDDDDVRWCQTAASGGKLKKTLRVGTGMRWKIGEISKYITLLVLNEDKCKNINM